MSLNNLFQLARAKPFSFFFFFFLSGSTLQTHSREVSETFRAEVNKLSVSNTNDAFKCAVAHLWSSLVPFSYLLTHTAVHY